MKRLVLIIMLLLVVLITGAMPQSAYAADNEKADMLTPQEQQFISDVNARINQARQYLETYRKFESRTGFIEYYLNMKLGSEDDKVFQRYKQRLNFSDCSINSAPSAFKDIQADWNTHICNKFAKMRSIVESGFKRDARYEDWTTLGQSMKDECDYIEDWLKEIKKRMDSQERTLLINRKISRDIVQEAEQEAKKDLGLKDDFCFIATAAYGTPTAKEIDELRRFRDEYLRKSLLGNKFIKFYYKNSPPIARFISEHEILRTVVREGVVDPIVKIVELTENYWVE